MFLFGGFGHLNARSMTKPKGVIFSAAVISNTRLKLIRAMTECGAGLSHRVGARLSGLNDELNDANPVSS